MYINVDPENSIEYERYLLNQLLMAIDAFHMDFKKWPDRIVFRGKLGEKLHVIVSKKKWNLNCLFINESHRSVNELEIYHSEKIPIKTQSGAKYDSRGNDKKEFEGWPSADTVAKFMSAYASPSFEVERLDHPRLNIELKETPLFPKL